MRLWGLLLCLLLVPQDVLSQVQLQESGPGLVKPSQTLSLTCAVSGFSIMTSNYCWHWVRQPTNKGLQWVGRICASGNIYYNPVLESRTSISRDTSKNQFSLQLSSVTPEDSAIYYCTRNSVMVDAYGLDVWGPGTVVTVSSVPVTSPKAFPLHNLSPESEEHMEVACLIQGFFPEPANVSWSHSGDEVTIRTFPPSLAASDGLYTMTSQLTMPAAQCSKNSPPRCHVQHFSYQQDVAMSCPVPPSCCEPRLSLHRPALEDLLLGSDASLTCTLSGLRDPKGATFTWQPTGGKDAVQGTPKLDSCGCYSVSSILPGCAEPWNSGEHFTCTATHPESTQLTATIFKPSGNTFRPQVHLLPPPSEELALNELVTLTCLVRGFSPEDVLVRWLDGSQELLPKDYVTWAPQPEPGNSAPTFAVISMLRVAAERWKDGQKYSCVVGHEALPTAFTQKTIDRQAGIPTRVNVSVIVAEAEGVCY